MSTTALSAERRIGELTREAPKAKGTRGQLAGGNTVLPPATAPTLAELGITKMQSSRWQALAAIPEKQFEEHVERVKAKAEKLTTSGTLAIASSRRPAKASDEDDEEKPKPAKREPSRVELDEWDDQNAICELEQIIGDIYLAWDGSKSPSLAGRLLYWSKIFAKGMGNEKHTG